MPLCRSCRERAHVRTFLRGFFFFPHFCEDKRQEPKVEYFGPVKVCDLCGHKHRDYREIYPKVFVWTISQMIKVTKAEGLW